MGKAFSIFASSGQPYPDRSAKFLMDHENGDCEAHFPGAPFTISLPRHLERIEHPHAERPEVRHIAG
ncbi:MAG TPA: hypothetical protein VN279_13950, partial [Rhodocyclaceae bacterium]|nr:hypothetical protein [Rhodocyclaceae bacterium]